MIRNYRKMGTDYQTKIQKSCRECKKVANAYLRIKYILDLFERDLGNTAKN